MFVETPDDNAIVTFQFAASFIVDVKTAVLFTE
jgi:hypothetical protein